jgi:hypothetical protein
MRGWCVAPRALRDSVRPRRLSDVVVRPLNFTVRRPYCRGVLCPNLKYSAAATAVTYGTPYRGRPSSR